MLVIIETLERRGTLNSIRGQIRAEVFNSLDDKASVKPKPSNDTILLNELVREYLEYNSYNYAAVTLRAGVKCQHSELSIFMWTEEN